MIFTFPPLISYFSPLPLPLNSHAPANANGPIPVQLLNTLWLIVIFPVTSSPVIPAAPYAYYNLSSSTAFFSCVIIPLSLDTLVKRLIKLLFYISKFDPPCTRIDPTSKNINSLIAQLFMISSAPSTRIIAPRPFTA